VLCFQLLQASVGRKVALAGRGWEHGVLGTDVGMNML
jgi:hypothetical protein